MVSILIYSITDFNLHIGANGLYFFFFAGLAVSASHTCLRDAPDETYLKRLHLPAKIPAVLIAVFTITCFAYNSGITIGKYIFSSIKDINLTDKMSPWEIEYIRDKSMKAAFFDPLEARYFYAVANTEKTLSNDETALAYYKKSVQRNPTNSEYLQRLGLLLNEFRRYDAAEKFLRSGIRYDAQNQIRYQRYALWLFSMGRRDEGIRITQQALALAPDRTREYITLMVLNRLSDEDIQRALPERVEPHLLFADYLYRTGKDRMAEGEYLNALKYIKNEKKITPAIFYSVYNYYMKKVLHADALSIMRQAAESLPDDAGIRITTGDLYERLNLPRKAAEEYKQALVIDPKNEGARKRLSNILSKNKNQ
jgi:tetratricopeptide (TPR) repeat protein